MLELSNFIILYNLCFFLILALIYTNTSEWKYSILYGNFELKHVTMVTDIRCFEKSGPGDWLYSFLPLMIEYMYCMTGNIFENFKTWKSPILN